MLQHAFEIMVITGAVMTMLSALGIACGMLIAWRKERKYLACLDDNEEGETK